MDPAYKEKLVLLNKIVHDGIAKLLIEAKNKNYLEPPYGRLPFPTPLITEDDFIKEGALHSDDAEPEFKFDYGFDPLKTLAEFIIWSHPKSVEARKQKKIEAAKFLERRAEHAKRQMCVSHNLSALAHYASSGVLWGPLCSPLSSSAVVVVCKPLRRGKVIFQISKFRDFREVLEKKEVAVASQGRQQEPPLDEILPTKATFKDLKPATKYFIRACLSSNPVVRVRAPRKPSDMSAKEEPEEDTEAECADLAFRGLHGGAFSYSEFWTLPSADRSAQEAIELEEPSSAADSATPDHHHGSHHHHHRHRHHHHHKKAETATTAEAADGDSYPPVLISCFGQLPVEAFAGTVAPAEAVPPRPLDTPLPRADPHCPAVTCLLGDLLPSGSATDGAGAPSEEGPAAPRHELQRDLSCVLARCPLFAGVQSPLHASSLLLAWRDGSEGSHFSLRAEELAYKQYRADVKRHKKKYAKTKTTGGSSSGTAATLHMPPLPTIARLPLSDSLQSVLRSLPVDPEIFSDPVPETPAAPAASATGQGKGKPNPAAAAAAAAAQAAAESMVRATRMMYRTQMMGPDVVLIVLDMRGQGTAGDYLGKEQATWLELVLQESATIQWKIILCGKTFGLINVPPEENPVSPEDGGVEDRVVTEAAEGVAGMALSEDGEPSTIAASVAEGAPLNAISEDLEMEINVPARSVQLPSAGDKTKAAIAAAMTEGVEDTYGRAACSLHHILAHHQTRTNQGPSAYNVSTASEGRVLHLSSGIVLLTSGLTSINQSLVVTPAAHHHHSPQQDIASPAYVAGYTDLCAAPISSTGAWERQVLPTGDKASRRIPSQLFCAEVSLGRSDLVNAGLMEDPKAATFFYRDGFEGHTAYSALNSSEQQHPSPAGPESAASLLRSSTTCSLHLLPSGHLSVKVFRADSALRDGTCPDPSPLFECLLEAPVPEVDEDDDLEEEQ